MKNLLLRKGIAIGIYTIATLVMECFMFVYLGFGFLPEYIFFDLSLLLFLSGVIFVFPCNKFQNIFICILLAFQMILCYINICMYKILNDVFTFEMLSLVKETTDVINFDMLPIWPMIFYILTFGCSIAGLILSEKIKVNKFKHFDMVKFVVKIISLATLTLSFLLYSIGSTYWLDGDASSHFSDKMLYTTFSSNKQSLVKFGTLGFYFEEFFRQFYKVDETAQYTRAELNAYVQSPEYDPEKLDIFDVCNGQNVIMIMMESFEWYAITPEATPTLYALSRGYDFGTKANGYKNFNFYNFSKDENGEFTVLERTDYTKINDEYKKLQQEGKDIQLFDEGAFDKYGFTLINYYSKAKTDYSESTAMIGNYPYGESFTTHSLIYASNNIYNNLDYSFTLANMLKDSGAVDVANYMHPYLSTFYGRDTLIPQFGFDNTLFLDQMSDKIPKGDRLSHATLDSKALDYYLNLSTSHKFIDKDKKFFNFFTTVTTHGEYSDNDVIKNNTDYYDFYESIGFLGQSSNPDTKLTDITPEQENEIKNYLVSTLDTERMVTILVKYLMDNDLFDNTMLCLFADHHSYYNQMDLFYKKHYFSDAEGDYSSPIYWLRNTSYNATSEDYIKSQDRFKVPAIIYSTKITNSVVGGSGGHQISKLTCSFDLPVTIMTLLGVDYNPAYYLGYPVKCEIVDEGKVIELGIPAYVSYTGGIFDLNIYTEEGKTIKFKRQGVTPVDELAFQYKVNMYIEKWYKITALYQNDMFEGFNVKNKLRV